MTVLVGHRVSVVILGAISAMILSISAVAIGSAEAAFPGANGRIAFTSGGELYTMRPDGTDSRRVIVSPYSEGSPALSPDGRRITFESYRRDANYNIYSKSLSGGATQKLTKDGGSSLDYDQDPTYSPDGSRIAYTRGVDEYNDIWVMNADGSEKKNLTRDPGYLTDPAWSPDGDKIAYAEYGIHVINADGTGRTLIAESGFWPTYSPDGSKIAYVRSTCRPTGCGYDIWVMNADGSGQKNLTRSQPMEESQPAWSPNGRKIAFTGTRDNNSDIYVMNADDTGRKNLSNSPASDEKEPDWGPRPATSP